MDSTWRRGRAESILFCRSTPMIILYLGSEEPFQGISLGGAYSTKSWYITLATSTSPLQVSPTSHVLSFAQVHWQQKNQMQRQSWPVCRWPGLGREPRRLLELVRDHQLELGSTESLINPGLTTGTWEWRSHLPQAAGLSLGFHSKPEHDPQVSLVSPLSHDGVHGVVWRPCLREDTTPFCRKKSHFQ